MKKTGLYGYVYDFSLDYDTTDAADILDIHSYLIKKRQKNVWIYQKKFIGLLSICTAEIFDRSLIISL